MSIFSVIAANGDEQIISEPEFNTLHDGSRFFEHITGDTRTLFPYSADYTNYWFFPEKGVEKSFDKPVFLSLIRKESDYRKLCKEQGNPCPKRFVLYNEGGLRVLTYVNSGVRVTSNTEEERTKKKLSRLRKDGITYDEDSLERLQEETDYEPVSDVDVESEVAASILPDELWAAVDNALPEKDAFIIRSYYRDGLTEVDIAAKLGVSQPRISQRRKRAEAILADSLSDFKIYLT